MWSPATCRLPRQRDGPGTIVDNIEVRFNEPVDLARDLIFFDEAGDCQPALDSLK